MSDAGIMRPYGPFNYIKIIRRGSRHTRVLMENLEELLIPNPGLEEYGKKVSRVSKDIELGIDYGSTSVKSPRKMKSTSLNEMKAAFNFPELKPKKEGEFYHYSFDRIQQSMVCGPVLLVGPAGSGKTKIAEQMAEALDLNFYFTGAVKDEYSLFGFRDANSRVEHTQFREAFEKGGVFLWDEIDASEPDVLVKFNMALANKIADFPDGKINQHPDFYPIAAANTYGTGADMEYVGRNQLDAATLDRFMIIKMDYDPDLEFKLVPPVFHKWVEIVQRARQVVRDRDLRFVVSPRATIYGAKLLAQSVPLKDVIDMTILKGMDEDAISQVKDPIRPLIKLFWDITVEKSIEYQPSNIGDGLMSDVVASALSFSVKGAESSRAPLWEPDLGGTNG